MEPAASRDTSDHRLHFQGTPDGESDEDVVRLTNRGIGLTVGIEPRLTVTYLPP